MENINDTSTADAVTGKAIHSNRIIQPKRAWTAFICPCYVHSIQFTN